MKSSSSSSFSLLLAAFLTIILLALTGHRPSSYTSDDVRYCGIETSHKVKKGETLNSISLDFYGTSHEYKALMYVNGIQDPRQLHEGEIIEVPKQSSLKKIKKHLVY